MVTDRLNEMHIYYYKLTARTTQPFVHRFSAEKIQNTKHDESAIVRFVNGWLELKKERQQNKNIRKWKQKEENDFFFRIFNEKNF